MSASQPTTSTTVTLDEVFKAVQHWRHNKKDYDKPGIPDTVWLMIFQLEDNGGYSPKELKRLFTLNSGQYVVKRSQLLSTSKSPAQPSTTVDTTVPPHQPKVAFAQVTVETDPPIKTAVPSLSEAANATRQVVSHLKSTHSRPADYLDPTTIIVECIRPDGHRLKIHTTCKRVSTVMDAFFAQGASPSC